MASGAEIARFAAMGTRIELHAFGDVPAGALAAAQRAIEAVDDALTIHRPSPATTLNETLLSSGRTALDAGLLVEALIAADEAHAATGGLFDIAADMRTGATWHDVRFDRAARTIFADRPLALDFGGLGKGFALDRAGAALRAAGVTSALLSAGESSIAVIGEHPLGGRWPFSIPHPLDAGTVLMTVELLDEAVSISATIGGGTAAPERTPSVLPGSPAPVVAPRCAIAIAASGADAEALSTALLVADNVRADRLLRGDPRQRFRFDLDAIASGAPIEVFA